MSKRIKIKSPPIFSEKNENYWWNKGIDIGDRRLCYLKHSYINIRQVCVLTGVCATTIHNYVKERKFPQPVRVNKNCARWCQDEVIQWMVNKKGDK